MEIKLIKGVQSEMQYVICSPSLTMRSWLNFAQGFEKNIFDKIEP